MTVQPATRPKILFLAVMLGFVWGQSARAGDTTGPVTRRLLLQPAEGPPLRIDFDFNFRRALPSFASEPAFAAKEIARGWLPTVPPTPLIRNITDNELYLNTEHQPDFLNGKLATYRSAYLGHVVFQDLRLSTVQGALTIPYTVDLFTYEHGCAGWLLVQSGWAGELELHGQQWRLGIVDNLDGNIGANDILFLQSLRPGKKELPLTLSPVPKTLFLNGQAFDLGFTFQPGSTGVVLAATLTESSPALGQLNLQAPGCRGLCLTNQRMAVVLEATPGPVSVPAGSYAIADCLLEREPGQFRSPTFIRCDQRLAVSAGQTSSLRLGLPLRNTVLARRDKNLLRLTYQLLGAGGEQYEYYNWANRPRFSVYKGPIKLASGKLPFG
ncbi:MAG: hypothetical protein ABSF95_23250 [Verrucomicrobiota bacterium]|jgi:hypothetical protein